MLYASCVVTRPNVVVVHDSMASRISVKSAEPLEYLLKIEKFSPWNKLGLQTFTEWIIRGAWSRNQARQCPDSLKLIRTKSQRYIKYKSRRWSWALIFLTNFTTSEDSKDWVASSSCVENQFMVGENVISDIWLHSLQSTEDELTQHVCVRDPAREVRDWRTSQGLWPNCYRAELSLHVWTVC